MVAVIKGFAYKALAIIASVLMLGTSGLSCGGNTEKKTDFEQCKKVILLIGDGMGFNTIEMAEQRLGYNLDAFDRFVLKGESKTASFAVPFTDSAAGGTALATGVRTALKCVGVYPDDPDAKKSYPMNLSELAISQGKSAGIVTTGQTWDATPAAFSAHVGYREEFDKINKQQCDGEIDFIWGMRDDDTDYDYAEEKGLSVLWNNKDLEALGEDERSIGRFSYSMWNDGLVKGQPTLAELTEKAIERLNKNENGFFLMVEGAHIDKRVDQWKLDAAAIATRGFARAIDVALDFAEQDGNTLVVVTADHETGNITKIDGEYVQLTTMHSPVNVPLFVYGCDDFMEQGEAVENREIGRRIANVMGEKNFPIEVKVAA